MSRFIQCIIIFTLYFLTINNAHAAKGAVTYIDNFEDACPYGLYANPRRETVVETNTQEFGEKAEEEHQQLAETYNGVFITPVSEVIFLRERYFDSNPDEKFRDYQLAYSYIPYYWCGYKPNDDAGDTGCAPNTAETYRTPDGTLWCNNSEPLKQCYDSQGNAFNIQQSKNCSDYCTEPNSFTGGPIAACSDGNTNTLSDTQPDIPDDLPDGDNSDNADSPSDSSDPDSSDNTDSSNDSQPSCENYQDCKNKQREITQCDASRDLELFGYVNNENYSYECRSCEGPSASSFPECAQCPYGFNQSTGQCFADTCKFGDCSDPDSELNQQPPELPEQPENGSETDIVDAIKDLQQQIASGIDVNDLDSLNEVISNFKSDNAQNLANIGSDITTNANTNTQELLTALSAIESAVNGIDLQQSGDNPVSTEPCTGDECSQVETLVQELVDIQTDIKCALTGEGECATEDTREPSKTASDFYTSFAQTQWGGTLNQIASSANGVSSSCNLDFSLYVPYAETDITAPICDYINPISGTLRMFAIALWGLLGIRHVFSA